MKSHSRLFLFIAILVLAFPALILACGGEEPADSTSADGSRPTEDAGTNDGGGGDAGRATPTAMPGPTPPVTPTWMATPAAIAAPTRTPFPQRPRPHPPGRRSPVSETVRGSSAQTFSPGCTLLQEATYASGPDSAALAEPSMRS